MFLLRVHLVVNPATHIAKIKKKKHSAEMQNKNTKLQTLLNKQKRTICVLQNAELSCPMASFEALLSLEKNHRRSNAIVERGLFLRLVVFSASLHQSFRSVDPQDVLVGYDENTVRMCMRSLEI